MSISTRKYVLIAPKMKKKILTEPHLSPRFSGSLNPIECKKKREHEIGDAYQKDFSTFMSKTAFFISELPQNFKITFLVNKISIFFKTNLSKILN